MSAAKQLDLVALAKAHAGKPARPAGAEETREAQCDGCGQIVQQRRRDDGGQGVWRFVEHQAPCGLACRWRERASTLNEEHGHWSCPVCGPNPRLVPKRRRARSRR